MPDTARLPRGATTRFAPAPTGYLHLGHVANAIYVWGIARAVGGTVLLRVEDHDRGRCRPEYEAALLEEMEWLGFSADRPVLDQLRGGASPYRQSDSGAVYEAALAELQDRGLVYACDCTRSTFARWAADHGQPWRGPRCPGGCRDRRVPEGARIGLRVALGDGTEAFDDLLAGSHVGQPSADGDLLAHDRDGNWTYVFTVVVDDLRHGIDLVIRGRDLVADTPRQIRLGRLLGRVDPPTFLHHPLVIRPDGRKLSKADSDTAIRELRADGMSADEAIGRAAAAVGLSDGASPISAEDVARLFASRR